MFRQLSFDTSKSDVHIALLDDQSLLSEHIVHVADVTSGTSRQEAANLLIPGIDRMMIDVGWKKADIDCIIVGTGPGGFTGIRTSVVTARALAQALFLPVYPVSILETYTSIFEGDFVIALYATAGHFFLARRDKSENRVLAAYVKLSDFAEFARDCTVIYADERSRAELNNSEEPVFPSAQPEIKELPTISNIAVQQASFAWQGLSLKVDGIYEKLGGLKPPAGKGTEVFHDQLRAALRAQFPYDTVLPTYLRAPSVTLKKTNV